MQEVTPEHARLFADVLADAYPYQALDPAAGDGPVGLLSRYPLAAVEWFRPTPASRWHVRAVVQMGDTPITVYVAHPRSPRRAYSVRHYDQAQREADLAILRQRLAPEPGPLIVLCDCNMSDRSDAYRRFSALLRDAFRAAGRGPGLSFTRRLGRWRLPMIRIDYVWHSAHFTARSARTWPASSSDHRPVVATLAGPDPDPHP